MYFKRHGTVPLSEMHSERLPCVEDPAEFGSHMLEVWLSTLVHGMEKTNGYVLIGLMENQDGEVWVLIE